MRHTIGKPIIISGIALLLLAVVFAVNVTRTVYAASELSTSGERLLVIHDGDAEQGILTKTTTVRSALDEANIPFTTNDLIEPALDEKLVASSYDINIYRARPVMVVDGAVRKKIMSAYRTPAQIAAHAGMELRSEDTTRMTLTGGTPQLVITRATPLTLVLYGKTMTIYTQNKTVGAMLDEKGITLGTDDRLSVTKETPITAHMVVDLWREGTQTVTVDEEVAFDVEQIRDVDRDPGFREVRTPGEKGARTVTYEIVIRNGEEVERKEINAIVTKEPVREVVVVGARAPQCVNDAAANRALGHQMMLAAGFGEDQWQYLDMLWTHESGWIECKANYGGSGAYGIPQALPGSKMGEGWQNDPEVQIRWGLGYIRGRYGNPEGAYNHWRAKNWY
jgi:uncharacterized protein YabE (DUF348 family)